MKPTLIIVDDMKAVRDELSALLAGDFQILGIAQSAAEAIEMCRLHSPQLVLMDVVMPQMSGIEATRALLADNENPPKVVVLSGLTDENVVMQALEAGACEYLFKPIDGAKLKEVLQHFAPAADESIDEIQSKAQGQ